MEKRLFEAYKNDLLRKAAKVRAAKEEEYLSTDDLLGNFRKIAQFREKETPVMIMDLGAKALQSISSMVNETFQPKTGTIGVGYTKDQWDEKFVDSINYLLKLYASIAEYNYGSMGQILP